MRHLNVSLKPSIFKSNQVNVNFLQGTISKMSSKPKMNLSHLIDGLPIKGTQGILDREISSIVFDSRKAEAGSLFVAIRGLKDDGFKFIDDAIARGASAFITEVSVDERTSNGSCRVSWCGASAGIAGSWESCDRNR